MATQHPRLHIQLTLEEAVLLQLNMDRGAHDISGETKRRLSPIYEKIVRFIYEHGTPLDQMTSTESTAHS